MSNTPNPLDAITVPASLKKINYYKDEKKLNCGYIKIEREDHTLGNIIHKNILKNKFVVFSGYKKTHPLEYFILFKIITDGNISPLTAFENVLQDIYIQLSQLETETKMEIIS
ncbi:ring-box protein 11 (nucleomorph) [Chroomonas mesostigmatica CCMP1168]|uniref:Ring-box protein 11 n=1 Tax=Chroomonas mesostigmatica CCMP1168 TaxID=1195612 RepID=J7G7P6_9CRYP|nr:ring-box protein 11 [Chroomonas mesostigmatica CCMP1168]|mmetsp:Transcript_60026/g.147605  ORF Transcript_60026/g.147605 Transcript_60026/m.147605 type:complete len:113 (-) Transcript_60026:1516-1854(-)